ncbi:MAG: type II toxin-antitoxin system HicB family antitoxin [Chloroflexota bacterium]
MLEYKGYQGTAEFDYDAGIFFGEVIDLRDVITFQGQSVEELEQSFRDSVEEYLKFCEEMGRTPDKPFSGKFNVRISSAMHRKLVVQARRDDKSLNQWVSDTLEKAIA